MDLSQCSPYIRGPRHTDSQLMIIAVRYQRLKALENNSKSKGRKWIVQRAEVPDRREERTKYDFE
jgi:hypothetical protein